ncbi:MAG: hypothetical protein JWR83_3110, partial [Aeromicrobium sp.]|nr:hypothetical protein [Aeromicrobium sp.]
MTTDLDTAITTGLKRLGEHVRVEQADEFRQRLSDAADVVGSSSARSVRPSSAQEFRPGSGAIAIAPPPRRSRAVLEAAIAGVLVIGGIVAIIAGNDDPETPTLQPIDADSLPSSETPTASAGATVVPPVTGPPTVDSSLTTATTAGTGTASGIDVTIATP